MDIFYPAYYHQFHCLAAACPDSCCKDWTVDVDTDTAQKYRALPGPLGDKLRGVLAEADGGTVITLQNGRCPMWQPDGLCQIQAQLGHGGLCKTCREFPRLYHDYGSFAELGLELSCPEAARLILTSPLQGMLAGSQSGGEEPDYDHNIMNLLRRSRKEVLAFLDKIWYPIPEMLAAILLYAHSVQGALDGADPVSFSIEDCLHEVKNYDRAGNMSAVFLLFQGLEIMTGEWKSRLACTPAPIQWTPPLRALARYMIQRYWLQAVSDCDLVCRVKLAIAACLVVGALGGNPIETAQLFSKEVENNPDNIETILDSAYTSPALTDANLLGLLLR